MILLRFVQETDIRHDALNCYTVFIGDYTMCEGFFTSQFEPPSSREYAVMDKTDFLFYRVVQWWLYCNLPKKFMLTKTNQAIELLFTDPPEKVLDLLLLTC